MKTLSVEEVRRAILGRWLSRGDAVSVNGVSTDTRTARAGDLFVALRGERFDGQAFLKAAAEAGCVAAVVHQDAQVPPEVANLFRGGLVTVADTTAALGVLAAHCRRMLTASVVAVTGSNGKTTVKRMIHHVLSKRLAGTCSPKSFNNNIGVPLTLLGAGAGDDYVVCEVGTNSPGEIAHLAAMIQPDIAVITSLAAAHLERFGTLARVAAEKASLLGPLAADGVAVIWGDSDLLVKAAHGYQRRLIQFGAADSAELRLTGYEPGEASQRFQLNGRLWVTLPLPGRHNAMNALAAIAVAQRFGFSQDDAAAALADFAGPQMRLERMRVGALTLINDAYNANPASLLAAADVLADSKDARRVLIAGDMRELGEQAAELHLQAGEAMAGKVDLLIGVGGLGRYIAMGAAKRATAARTFETVEQACQAAPGLLRAGDLVLIKGSRAMAMERLIAPIRAAFAPDGGQGPQPKGSQS